MTIRCRRWLLLLGVLALATVVLPPGCRLLGRRLVTPDYLLDQVRRRMGPGFPGKLQLRAALYDFPFLLQLEDVCCSMPPVPEKPLFRASRMLLRVFPMAIPRGHYAFECARFYDFEVNLFRGVDGRMNLPETFWGSPSSGTATGAPSGAEPPVVAVGELSLRDGRLAFDDSSGGLWCEFDRLQGDLSMMRGQLRIDRLTGFAFGNVPFTVSGQMTSLPSPTGELLLDAANLDLGMVQDRVPWLKSIRDAGVTWDGNFATKTRLRLEPSGSGSSSALTVTGLAIRDPRLTLTRLRASRASGSLELRTSGGRPTWARLELAAPNLEVLSLTAEPSAVVTDALLGVELAPDRTALRTLRGHLGQGEIDLGSSGDGSTLQVRANRLELGRALVLTGHTTPRPWLAELGIDTFQGTFAGEELRCTTASLRLGADATVTFTGAFRVSAAGIEPAGVSGNARVPARLFGQLTGLAEPGTLGGKLSARFTAGTTGFTAELRSRDLVVAGLPELRFRALAAALRTPPARGGRPDGTRWTANLHAGEFTLFWPQLLEAAGIPLEGPVTQLRDAAVDPLVALPDGPAMEGGQPPRVARVRGIRRRPKHVRGPIGLLDHGHQYFPAGLGGLLEQHRFTLAIVVGQALAEGEERERSVLHRHRVGRPAQGGKGAGLPHELPGKLLGRGERQARRQLGRDELPRRDVQAGLALSVLGEMEPAPRGKGIAREEREAQERQVAPGAGSHPQVHVVAGQAESAVLAAREF